MQVIIWPWNFQVKVTVECMKNLSVKLVATLMVIVAQTDNKYGRNACLGIYFSYFRLYFHVQFTMNITVTNVHIFLRSYYLFIINVLKSNPKSYFALNKWHIKLKHKHHYYSWSNLARYVVSVLVGLGYKIEVYTHNSKLPDNYQYVFSKHSCPMLRVHNIKKSILRGAIFGAYTDPSFWKIVQLPQPHQYIFVYHTKIYWCGWGSFMIFEYFMKELLTNGVDGWQSSGDYGTRLCVWNMVAQST